MPLHLFSPTPTCVASGLLWQLLPDTFPLSPRNATPPSRTSRPVLMQRTLLGRRILFILTFQHRCLNPSGLAPLAQIGANASILPDLTTWLQGMCNQSLCTNAQLSALVTNFTAGCPGEAAKLGLNKSTETAVIQKVQAAYPTERKILCLTTYVLLLSPSSSSETENNVVIRNSAPTRRCTTYRASVAL
jgi:hypothetical protein